MSPDRPLRRHLCQIRTYGSTHFSRSLLIGGGATKQSAAMQGCPFERRLSINRTAMSHLAVADMEVFKAYYFCGDAERVSRSPVWYGLPSA
jgi:hypothetical protein